MAPCAHVRDEGKSTEQTTLLGKFAVVATTYWQLPELQPVTYPVCCPLLTDTAGGGGGGDAVVESQLRAPWAPPDWKAWTHSVRVVE